MSAKLKREALESYRHELLIWSNLAPHSKKKPEPPKLPAILKD